ncbi:MAG: hypothetical protein EA417_06735 [Gammaproteobacteria bacterium]|nr:MAG: hypothetical protein EA417_06735 [Gammaproteobacteria bacterium]
MAQEWTWWGSYRVPIDEARYWRIGALDLFVARRDDGWLVQSFEHARDEVEDPPLEIASEIAWMPGNTQSDVVHYKAPGFDDSLTLVPRLADRAVVSRPRMPFNIAPDASVTLYVGTPLWVELKAGVDAVTLCELPLMRPSQTWFGSSTVEGALCYAARTYCRTNAQDVPLRPWRAISPLRLENRAKDGWMLDRVVLPVPQLPLFVSTDGRLWTSSLSTRRDHEGKVGDIRVGDAPPVEPGPWTEQGKPRRSGSSSILGRFYGNLF